ncbi:MAG TPA: hypothetical protein VIF62_14980 [Labilithrix sp.]
MKRAAVLAAIAVIAAHVVMRAAGLAEHTSVLAGMPRSDASWVIGPLYVLVHLGAVIVAPVALLAAVADRAFAHASSRSSSSSSKGPSSSSSS